MKNPLTSNIESWLGVFFVSAVSVFVVSTIIISVKNFETDIDVMNVASAQVKVSGISQSEVLLMREWADSSGIVLREGGGYRYLLRQYPHRPWADLN